MFCAINNKGEYYELVFCSTRAEAETWLGLLLGPKRIAEEEWEIVEE